MVHGEPYEIVDIGMRMLTAPRAVRRAGFSRTATSSISMCRASPLTGRQYVSRITGDMQGRMVGNSVSPPLAAALVSANYRDEVLVTDVEHGPFTLEAAE